MATTNVAPSDERPSNTTLRRRLCHNHGHLNMFTPTSIINLSHPQTHPRYKCESVGHFYTKTVQDTHPRRKYESVGSFLIFLGDVACGIGPNDACLGLGMLFSLILYIFTNDVFAFDSWI